MVEVQEGFHVGLLVTAFGIGLRHGIDWDHLAAIADITSAQSDRRRSMVLASLYAAGHAVVVFVLGVAAIVAGDRLPEGVDDAMGRVVGVTLILLGAYVFVSLARHGRDFRLRSRWTLLFAGIRRLWRRVVVVEHDHPHDDDHHGPEVRTTPTAGGRVAVAHRHAHRHVGVVPPDPFDGYGWKTALGIGALHGVGAETPTQVVLFVSAAGVAGAGGGVLMLVAFLARLVATNTAVALAATYGFLQAERHWRIYVSVAALTGAASLAVGTLYVFGG